jgi:hypothetical protein
VPPNTPLHPLSDSEKSSILKETKADMLLEKGGKSMTLNPVPCFSSSDPDSVPRKVFCDHYEVCLDYVLKKGWDGFSCHKCTAYRIERKSPEEWAKEAERCALLMQVVAFSGVGYKVGRRHSYLIKKRGNEYEYLYME